MKSFSGDLDSLLTVAAAVLDTNGVLLEANAGFLRLLPSSEAPRLGTRVGRFFLQPLFPALVAMVGSDGHGGYQGLLTFGDYAGKSRTLRGRVWPSGTTICVLAEYDIDELEKLNEVMLDLNRESSVTQHSLLQANVLLKQREGQISEVSLTDALTGVGNRRKLQEALETEISRVRRAGGPLCAIMADLDHFKLVNDELGHAAGDKVLARFGALLRSNTRSTDVVARYGGEEFVVLLPHTSLAQAVGKAEQIRVALAAEVIKPLSRPVTASFGVVELAEQEDAASFLNRVDAAMYQAKADGRNRVVMAGGLPTMAHPGTGTSGGAGG
jgi:diguanylate cyclase (GGDEF)-like protein